MGNRIFLSAILILVSVFIFGLFLRSRIRRYNHMSEQKQEPQAVSSEDTIISSYCESERSPKDVDYLTQPNRTIMSNQEDTVTLTNEDGDSVIVAHNIPDDLRGNMR